MDCVLREVVSLTRGAGGKDTQRQQRCPGGSEEGSRGPQRPIPRSRTCVLESKESQLVGVRQPAQGPSQKPWPATRAVLCVPAQATFSPGSALSPRTHCSTGWSLRSASSSSNYDPVILKDTGAPLLAKRSRGKQRAKTHR